MAELLLEAPVLCVPVLGPCPPPWSLFSSCWNFLWGWPGRHAETAPKLGTDGAFLVGILFPIVLGWATICQKPHYLTFQFLCTPFLMCKQTVSVLAKDAYYKSINIRILMQIISPYICLICQFRFFRFPVKLCPAIEVVSRTASLVETDNWEDLETLAKQQKLSNKF